MIRQNNFKKGKSKTFRNTVFLGVGSIAAAIIFSNSVMASHGITSSCVSDTNCPKEDVANTKHNLAHNRDILAEGTTEICVFCHTPHGANTNAGGAGGSAGAAPLWNRMLPDDTAFQVYSSPNFDAQGGVTGSEAGRPKGVSLACLSCHDGSIAIDALINAPGSGGYTPANNVSGSGPGTKVFPAFKGPFIATDGSLTEDATKVSTEDPLGRPAVPFPNLSQDLRDDHPIGMAMPDPSVDPQFTEAYNTADLNGGTVGVSVWFIKGRQSDGSAQTLQTDKRDRVRLYPSTGAADKMYVECASCHNPHTPRPVFLRLPKMPGTDTSAPATAPNSQSALCLTCHSK